MSKVQYTTFVKDEFQLISAFLALRSLQALDFCEKQPIILVPKPLIAQIEEKHPKLKVQNMIRKLGGNMKDGFAKGFNPRNSFRGALGNLARKVGKAPMMYFAPTTIFFGNPEEQMVIGDVVAARAPDQYWPARELYGPKMETIWSEIAEIAGVDPQDWFDDTQPKEYWRRYPVASTQLIYMSNAEEFAEVNAELSKEIISNELPSLQGQGRDLVEATIAATVMKLGGKIADIEWDDAVMAFDTFPQLVLRVREYNREQFEKSILDFQGLRSTLKKIHEYKICLYHNALVNTRNNFDEIEGYFSPLRMDMVIERRKIDKKIKGLIREAKKAEIDAENLKKIDHLAQKLAAENADGSAL